MGSSSKPILGLPCSMRTEDFTNDIRGIHCGSCDKVLTDFRGRSDKEVRQIIRDSSKKVCGVFDAGQYDYKKSTIAIPSGIQRFGLSLLGILGFLGSVLTSCSDNDTRTVSAPEQTPPDKIQQAFNKLKFPMKIEGVLRDSGSDNVMSFTKVSIFQNGKVIRTDETDKEGNFSIVLNRGDLIRENFEFAITKAEFTDTLKNYSVFVRQPGEKLELTVSATCSVENVTGFIVPQIIETQAIRGEIAPEIGEIAPEPTAGVPLMPLDSSTESRDED